MAWNFLGIIALFLTVCSILRYIILYWRKQNNKNVILRSFVEVGLRPFLMIVFAFGVLKAVEGSHEWAKNCDNERLLVFLVTINPYLGLCLTAVVTYLLLVWKKRIFQSYQTDAQLMQTYAVVLPAFEKMSTVFIFILGINWALTQLDVDLSVLFAVGGIGGIATGFAAKDVVSNFFGGVMIFINRPFIKGERIKSPNRHFEGVVDEIGFYMTRLKTLDSFPIYIPNGLITDAIIENSSRRTQRRLKTTIGIRYCDFNRIPDISKKLTQFLEEDPRIENERLHTARFSKYGESSLNIDIIAYTQNYSLKDWFVVQEELLLCYGEIVQECGAQLAYPTQTIQIEGNSVQNTPQEE
ncbi:MAG: MscS family membrane protein [Chlamydiales bacterium]|jgi:MscS family membrane protein